MVLDKTGNDDRLIAALRLEVAGLRRGGPTGGASGWSPKGSPKAAEAGRGGGGGGGLKGETSSRCGGPTGYAECLCRDACAVVHLPHPDVALSLFHTTLSMSKLGLLAAQSLCRDRQWRLPHPDAHLPVPVPYISE